MLSGENLFPIVWPSDCRWEPCERGAESRGNSDDQPSIATTPPCRT